MTITSTETPRLVNRAERTVYRALLAQLQPNDLVVPGQRVTDHLKDHEVDFVVAMEGAGIVCLEVKGGEVWHDGAGWCQMRGGKHVHIEPVRQAREACYALRDYIESDPRWTLKRPRWDHVVVLPNTKLPTISLYRNARAGRSSTAPSSTSSCKNSTTSSSARRSTAPFSPRTASRNFSLR